MIKDLFKQIGFILIFVLSMVGISYAQGSSLELFNYDLESFLEEPFKTLGEAFSYPGEDMYINIYEGLKNRTDAEALGSTSEKFGYDPQELNQILGGSITPILQKFQAGFDPLSQKGVLADENSIQSPLLTEEQKRGLTVRADLTLEQANRIVQQVRNDYENKITLFQLQNEVKVVSQAQSIFADGNTDNSGFDIISDLNNMKKILFGSQAKKPADTEEQNIVANQSKLIDAVLSGNTTDIGELGLLEARNNERLKNTLYNSIKNDLDLKNRVTSLNDKTINIFGHDVSANSAQCYVANGIKGLIERDENADCGLPTTQSVRLVADKTTLRPGEKTKVYAAILTTNASNPDIQNALNNPPQVLRTSRFNQDGLKVNILDFDTKIKLQESNPNALKLSPTLKKVEFGIAEFEITAPTNSSQTKTALKAYTSSGIVVESDPIEIILPQEQIAQIEQNLQPQDDNEQLFNPDACYEDDAFSNLIDEARTEQDQVDQGQRQADPFDQPINNEPQLTSLSQELDFDEIEPAESCDWGRSIQWCAGQGTNTCQDLTKEYLGKVPEEARNEIFGINSAEEGLANFINPEILTVRANFCLEVEFIDRPESEYPKEESCIQCHVQHINDTFQDVLEHNLMPGKATGNLGELAICKKTRLFDNLSFDIYMHSKPIMTPSGDDLVFSSDPFKAFEEFVAAYNPVQPMNLPADDPTYFDENNPGTPNYENEIAQQFFSAVQAGQSINIVFTELRDRIQEEKIRQQELISNIETASDVSTKSDFFKSVIVEMRKMNGYFTNFQDNLIEINKICSDTSKKPYPQ